MKGYCQICMVTDIELEFTCPNCNTGRCLACNTIINNQGVSECLNSLCIVPDKSILEILEELNTSKERVNQLLIEAKRTDKFALIGFLCGFFLIPILIMSIQFSQEIEISLFNNLFFWGGMILGGGSIFFFQQERLEELTNLQKELELIEHEINMLDKNDQLYNLKVKQLSKKNLIIE